MPEGDQHKAAVNRIAKLLRRRGAKVEIDMSFQTEHTGRFIEGNDGELDRYVRDRRVKTYYPDITAIWTPIIIEINGPVGHSSKRSHDNELNQKAFFEDRGYKFFTYAPTEIAGRGWLDSKGVRHLPHTDEELYADWGL